MTTRASLVPASLLLVLVAVIAACSGAASQSPAASASASAAPSASASAEPSVAPSEAPSASASMDPIPSFSLPSDDKALEALLPSTICGADALKFSMSGATFMSSADPEFIATLERLGKAPEDVVFAVAGAQVADCEEVAGVFKITGAPTDQLQAIFLEEAANEGGVATPTTLGGRSVYEVVDDADANPTYAYFAGDAIFFVSAPDDTAAATLLAQMP